MNLFGHAVGPAPRWFESSAGRTGRFDAVATAEGKEVAVLGTRVAREGLAFLSSVALRERDLPVSFTIRRRTIPSRVRIVRHEPFRDASRLVHRYYCAFTAIAESDQEFIGRYVEGASETAPAPPEPRHGISLGVQARIADELVKRKRLTPAAPGLAPLIRLEPEPPPLAERDESRFFSVHSRIRTPDGIRGYVTRVRVSPGERVEVLD